ncbi:thiamine pyrophosphate-binding protein [Aestuariibius insulae]|uniref:thiamine pyrophosphate-binding protein n=1 Tax=Aestuariibius insulae TaxID=2058287 RepID=UPI00345E9EE3
MRHNFDLLADVVAQEKIGTCFSLLGDANMNFATRLSEAGCTMIYVRHEHCAVAAAMAYARKTRDMGLATVTCGPGLTQLMTALPAAVRARLPLVVIAGEPPLKAAWYNQQIDQAPLVIATGAAYHSIHWPGRIATATRDAFLQARRERRPVVLGIPFDLQDLEARDAALPIPSHQLLPKPSPMPPHPDDVVEAAKTIAAAKKIVVMAGLGATHAAEACRALAERCDAPLGTTLPARGLFHDEPFSLGILGGFATDLAWEVCAEADLIIAVGGSLSKHNSDGGKLWPKADVLQIDTDPVAVSQGRIAAQSHLRADARLGVEALLDVLPPRQIQRRNPDLANAIATRVSDSAPADSRPGTHDPRDAIAALDAALPDGWQLVNSSGHCSYYAAHMPRRPYEEFLTIREFGAIGNGISFAMGVALARPDVPVVMFDGDGSLLMHIQELETIQRHNLNILIVALNDGAYGSEIHKLRAEGLSDEGAVFGRTDLAAIARGFGLGGETVADLSTLPDLVKVFTASGTAAVWDIPINDRIASPVIRRAHPPK